MDRNLSLAGRGQPTNESLENGLPDNSRGAAGLIGVVRSVLRNIHAEDSIDVPLLGARASRGRLKSLGQVGRPGRGVTPLSQGPDGLAALLRGSLGSGSGES